MEQFNPYDMGAAPQYRLWQKNELRSLRRMSRAGGCALLYICAMQLVLALGLDWLAERAGGFIGMYVPGAEVKLYWDGFTYLLIGLFAVMPGVLIGLRMLSPAEHNLSLPFRRESGSRGRESGGRFTTAKVVFAGAFLCFAGNLASSLLASFAGRFGYGFMGPEETPSETTAGFLFMMLAVAIVPAVGEEALIRGMVMQPLRRYGDGFALVCSALLFAVLHQNLAQAPMAFVSGLAIGWAALRTGTLWAPILIHMWNNGASVILRALEKPLGEERAGAAMTAYMVMLVVLGALALASLWRGRDRQPRPANPIGAGARAVHYFFGSPAMVVALAYMAAMLVLTTMKL